MKKFFLGDNNYGFIKVNKMSDEKYIEQAIDGLDFKVNSTADFSNEAKNHCGATLAVNLYKLFNNRYNFHSVEEDLNLDNRDNALTLFKDIHKYVPNGPVLFLARKIKSYFSSKSIDIKYKKIPFKKLLSSLDANKPVAILLADGLFNWHWVLAVGYRVYADGTLYLRLISNHDRTSQSYYIKNSGSWLAHACEYSIKNLS